MIDWIGQAIDPVDLFSPILGGVITLLVAVGVSRREFNRRIRQRRNNWYRSIHTLCIRAQAGSEIDQTNLDTDRIKFQAQQYRLLASQVQDRLPDAPTEEIGLHLFNSLQNIESACIQYVNETETANPFGPHLQNRHEIITTFGAIAQYIIERERSPNIEFLNELDDDEAEAARESYRDWVDGTLFEADDELDEEMREFLGIQDGST